MNANKKKKAKVAAERMEVVADDPWGPDYIPTLQEFLQAIRKE